MEVDLHLQASAVAIPATLKDGNTMSWSVKKSGAVSQGFHWNGTTPRLSVVRDGVPFEFTGPDCPSTCTTSSEEDKRELVLVQGDLGGLEVTRKVYVARDGYFLRHLDLLHNPGTEAVAVDVVEEADFGATDYVATSSGDGVVSADDGWVVLDDDDPTDIFDTSSPAWAVPPTAFVAAGPGGVAPTVVELTCTTGSRGILTRRWDGIAIPPGGTVAFLHVVSAQSSRDRAVGSAERLAQLPGELLAGLEPEEAEAVYNAAVPPDLVSSVPPLPPNDGVIQGRVLGGDGETPIASAGLRFRSRSLHYGHPVTFNAAADGSFLTPSPTASDPKLVPREAFDLTASKALGSLGTVSHTVSGDFPATGEIDLASVVDRAVRASSTAPSSSVGRAVDGNLSTHWQSVSGDSASKGRRPSSRWSCPATPPCAAWCCGVGADGYSLIHLARVEIRDAAGAQLWSTELPLAGGDGEVDVPTDVPGLERSRSVRVTSLLDYSNEVGIAEIQVIGEADLGPTGRAATDVVLRGSGVVRGQVLRSDGTAVNGGSVWLREGSKYTSTTRGPATRSSSRRCRRAPTASPRTTRGLRRGRRRGGGGPGRVRGRGRDPRLPRGRARHRVSRVRLAHRHRPDGGRRLHQREREAHRIRLQPERRRAGHHRNLRLPRRPAGRLHPHRHRQPLAGAGDARGLGGGGGPHRPERRAVAGGPLQVTATVAGVRLAGGEVAWQSDSRGPSWINVGTRTSLSSPVTVPNVPGPTVRVRVGVPGTQGRSFGIAEVALAEEAQPVPVEVEVPGVGEVAGVLLSRDGTPLGGVEVSVLHATDTTELGATTSDAAGAFLVSNVPVGPVRLRSEVLQAYSGSWTWSRAEVDAVLTGHDARVQQDALGAFGALDAPGQWHVWQLAATAGERVRVRLIGTAFGAHAALGDPLLEVYGADGALVAGNDNRSGSDLNSLVDFTAPEDGVYTLLARAAGEGTGGYRLASYTPTESHVFRAVGATSVDRRHPACGRSARGRARGPPRAAGSPVFTTRTDPSGSFAIPVFAPGAATVEAADAEDVVIARQEVVTSAGAVEAHLAGPARVPVTVRVTRLGAVVAGVAVTIESDNTDALPGDARRERTTSADGEVETVVPIGLVRATVVVGGVTYAAEEAATGPPVLLEIQLAAPPATISGSVTGGSDATAVPGATVEIVGLGATTTDAAGASRFDLVPAGTYTLRASLGGAAVETSVVQEGGDVEVHMALPVSILRGRVLEPDGRGAQATVEACADDVP